MSTVATKTTNTVRTVWGLMLQAAVLQQTPLQFYEHSTMNEKLDIQSGVYPPDGNYPKLGYYAFGIGGLKASVDVDGLLTFDNYQHQVSDAMPFTIVPLVLRETTNDITVTERANYGLRKRITVNDVSYYAYYLRRMNLTGVKPTINKKVISNGVAQITPWTPDSSVMNPQPVDYTATDAAIMDGTYLMVNSPNSIELELWEITELLNVGEILFGNAAKMNIGEVCLVSGVDKVINVDSNGSTVTFKEVIAAQVNDFIPAMVPLSQVNNDFTMTIDLGGGDPMYTTA